MMGVLNNHRYSVGFFSALVAAAIVAVWMPSCAFRRLKTDIQAAESQVVLVLKIETDDTVRGDVVAVVYTPYHGAQRVSAFRVIDPEIELTMFILEEGEYRVALFRDRNRNLVIDENEPVELLNRGRRLPFSEVSRRVEMKVELPETSRLPKGYPRDFADLPESIGGDFHLAIGDIMHLEDERFSKAAGRLGLWEPNRFLREYGIGIYMAEPYDSTRIPVLFVNGAGGSAQNWRFFFENLDRSRFQAWFYLYPSGVRIPKLGKALNDFMAAMAKKFDVDEIHVVAHSMGGLVSREAIVRQIEEDSPLLVKKFITISTPWNGHAMAEKGVDAFFTAVPSWHDVVPGSPFLQTVFNTPLKPKVDHHLLFGFRTGSEEDGSVALSSVLLEEAQEDAVEVRAFEGNHVEVLFSEDVFDYVEDILIHAADRKVSCGQQAADEGDAGAPSDN